MIYVGIDVASEKHDVCIMSKHGEIFKLKIQNQNTKNFSATLMMLRSCSMILKYV